jgi:hypothetical protein
VASPSKALASRFAVPEENVITRELPLFHPTSTVVDAGAEAASPSETINVTVKLPADV